MNKTQSKAKNNKNLFSNFITVITIFSCFLIISCNNFMNSKNVADDIQTIIAYNNAPECNVLFKSDDSYGSFLTGETLILKVGFETEIKFKLNKDDYVFSNFEAVSKTNPDTSLADYVIFTQKEADEENGIYTINVKITNKTSDLMIRPVCIAYPAVISYSPVSNEPQYANMPIVINFNMPMINEDTQTSVEINYDNISITAGVVPLKDYFEAPIFNEDKTKLTLTPKANELKKYINKLQADFIEVKVMLSEDIKVKCQNHTIAIRQNKSSSFIIKYKGEIDTTPPQRLDFFVTRHPITIETADSINDSDKFLLEVFDTRDIYNDQRYDLNFTQTNKNKCNGTIYIYGKYYEKKDCISSVMINETPYNSDNAEFFSDGNGNTTFCIKHNLTKSYKNELECYVVDKLNIESTHINFTAYHKMLDADQILVYNFEEDFFDASLSNFDLEYYDTNKYTLKFSYSWDDSKGYECNPFVGEYLDKYKNDYYTHLNNISYYENFVFECEYTDKDGNPKHGKFQNDKENLIFYYTLENVDKLNGLKVNILVTDDVDNHDKCEIVFPVASALKTITKTNTDTIKIDFEPFCIGLAEPESSETCFEIADQILLYKENGIYKTKIANSNTFTIQKDIDYQVIPIHCDSLYPLVMLYGDIGTQIYNSNYTVPNIPDVVLDGEPFYEQGDYTWKGGLTSGDQWYDYYMDITVKIADDSWDIFDLIYVSVSYWDIAVYQWSNTIYNFKKNEYEIKFSHLLDYMHANDTKITVYGIKNNQRSQGTLFTIPKFLKTAEDDHNPPMVQFIKNNTDRKYVIKFSDGENESGPDYAYVVNIKEGDDYKYKLDSSNSYTIEFPFWELTDASNIRYSKKQVENIKNLEVIGYDKKGNKCIGQTRLYIYTNDYYSYPATPDSSHQKDYDLMIPNGTSKKSVAIGSNAPVMVHTVITTAPYSECKDWPMEEWEHYKKTINPQTLNFTDSDHSPKRYSIPYDDINEGECYCVIAWFADGTYEKSEVWQK